MNSVLTFKMPDFKTIFEFPATKSRVVLFVLNYVLDFFLVCCCENGPAVIIFLSFHVQRQSNVPQGLLWSNHLGLIVVRAVNQRRLF